MKRSITYTLCQALISLSAACCLSGCGTTTSTSGPQTYTQVDRIGRPEVAEICLTVANNQSQAYATGSPSNDAALLQPHIAAFLTHAAGRSQALANTASTMLSPDMMAVNIGQPGPAKYMDAELGGAGKFGGRALEDDAVTTDLTLFFGNTLGNDGAATPGLTTDNITATTDPKHFRDGVMNPAVFPYLGAPR